MKMRGRLCLSGAAAGLINGLFGGGGGMPLVLLFGGWCHLEQKKSLATCVAVIFPICIVSAAVYFIRFRLSLLTAMPYLIGGLIGGAIGGKTFPHVPNCWLRRIFGAFLLYGGVRYLL
jgi:uncharacterized membrane protein YfcA